MCTRRHVRQFEDGIKCDYEALLTRARLCEVALCLGPLAARMDVRTDVDAASLKAASTVQLQRACVAVARRCMNITRLQRGVDRLRNARAQDVGRLITYGQVRVLPDLSAVECARCLCLELRE